MIPLEGRILDGLDEFMLRLGHLTVLSRAASEAGASWHRVEKDTAAQLVRAVKAPADALEELRRYVERKRLCCVLRGDDRLPDEREREKYRYPHLAVRIDEQGEKQLLILDHSETPLVWWQDLCLAGPGVSSRVGAVTVSAKAGSKTGISHVADWSQMLGLISKSGDALPIGRMIGRLSGENPYVIGWERLAYAYIVLSADFDVFSRFVVKLAAASSPIRKSDGTKLFVHSISDLAQEARDSRDLSTRGKRAISDVYRDLESAGRRSRRPIDETSTAWHRASSRLETYTDLGFLRKGVGGEEERYEYVYYHTDQLARLPAALANKRDVRSWIEESLVSHLTTEEALDSLEEKVMLRLLPRVAATLARPSAPLPLETLSIGLAWLGAEEGNFHSFAACRHSLETFAMSRPELARLSRGGYGDRAEFISLDIRKVEELSA